MDPAVEMWREAMAYSRGPRCRASASAAAALHAAALAGADYSRRFAILENGLSEIARSWA